MANRYWVGGTGTWDASNTTNWAATSGGAGGQSVPGPSDAVLFDGASGTSFTVTIGSGYSPTVASISGGIATVTLNLNDQTLNSGTFNFSGSAVRTIAFGTGQINVTGNNASVFLINVDTNMTITGSKNVYFTYSGSAGTRTISTSSTAQIANTGCNYYIQSGTDTVTISGASGIVCRDIDFTGFSGTMTNNVIRAYGNVTLSPTMTITSTATTWTFQGPSGGTQTFTTAGLSLPSNMTINSTGGTVLLADNVSLPATGVLTLTAGTLNFNDRSLSVGRVNVTGALARTLAFGTTGVLNITGENATVWNGAAATNFSYTGVGRVNFTYNGSVGTRGIQHGTTSGGSVATKPPPMYVTGGSDILDPKIAGTWYSDLDYTGYTGTVANLATNFAGNLILNTGMLVTGGANAYTFLGNTATQTITTNGVATDFPITISGSGTTFQLSEPLVLGNSRALTVSGGNLNANGYDITTGTFVSSNGNPRAIDISNTTVTINGTGTGAWNMTASGNATLQAANSTIVFANSSTTVRGMACGDGLTYGNMVISGADVAQFNFSGSGTFDTISTDKTVSQAIFFDSDTTTTVTNWGVVGTANATVSISAAGINPFNLVKAGGGTVDVSYHTISYSNASPSNTWYALFTDNNNDGGTNTGWIFELPATSSSNFFLVF